MCTSFKIESGVQLLARLTRKLNVENFYPVLFQDGPKQGEVIEIYSECNMNSLLNDLICEALLPMCFGKTEFSILLFNCNSNFNFGSLVSCMRRKISIHLNIKGEDYDDTKQNELLEKLLKHILIAEVYDATQLYATIHNLERVSLENSDIALLIFDTITAFYWTEQEHKINKMDVYIKNLLHIIQKVSKEHKATILYTRPEYFSSSKDSLENLEACSQFPVFEKVNYRIQVVQTNEDNLYHVNIRTYNSFNKNRLYMDHEKIKWIQ